MVVDEWNKTVIAEIRHVLRADKMNTPINIHIKPHLLIHFNFQIKTVNRIVGTAV